MGNWRNSCFRLGSSFIKSSSLLLIATALFAFDAQAACLDALDSLQPGEWYEVPNSKLESSGVTVSPSPPGNTGVRSVIIAWSGGAYDTKRDRLMVWGGGHSDYAGNEIYAFDVKSCSWTLVAEPSPNSQIHSGSSCSETYGDGKPSSRHTYDGIEYLPASDRMWAQGGSLWCGAGQGGLATWEFDLTNERWVRRDNAPQDKLGVTSAHDPSTGKVFMRAYTRFSEYNPANGTWTVRSNEPGYGVDADANSAAIDAKNNLYVEVGDASIAPSSYVGVRVWDLSNFSYSEPRTTSGSKVINGEPGVVYDPILEKIVAYPGGTSVYSLDTRTWAWTEHPAAASNRITPPTQIRQGMFGRFRYMPSQNAYIFVNDSTQNVYFYKLSEGAGTPPPVATKPEAPGDLTVD